VASESDASGSGGEEPEDPLVGSIVSVKRKMGVSNSGEASLGPEYLRLSCWKHLLFCPSDCTRFVLQAEGCRDAKGLNSRCFQHDSEKGWGRQSEDFLRLFTPYLNSYG
jgi:hypothetical protein